MALPQRVHFYWLSGLFIAGLLAFASPMAAQHTVYGDYKALAR